MMTVIDAIDVLKSNNAQVVVSSIDYEAESKVSDDCPKFIVTNPASPIYNVVFNENRANLSVLLKIVGQVEIGENNFGLPEMFDTFSWRNYTVIRDGKLNLKKLSVKVERETFDKLKEAGVISGEYSEVVEIDLTQFPLTNITEYEISRNMKEFFNDSYTYNLLKSGKKVYASFMKEDKKASRLEQEYGAEAAAFLASKCITDNGYSAKMVKREEAVEKQVGFNVSLKGYNTVPSVNTLLKKIETGKRLNSLEVVMKAYYDICMEQRQSENFKNFLNVQTEDLKNKLEQMASKLGRYKISVVANDFSSLNTEIEVSHGETVPCQFIVNQAI